MNTKVLPGIIKQFEYYKSLGDKSFEQSSDSSLFWTQNSDSNSIAIIVKHLWGNMLSRWTDFLTSDGEKSWRKRDEEFEGDPKDREEMLVLWEEGWSCLFHAVRSLNENDLDKTVFIRNQGHTVIEAINRQLAHYAYHIGQIVYIAKLRSDKIWKTLSIAKGDSKSFNSEKFSRSKSDQHFTDEFLNKDS